jgi:hypothetical protein
MKVIDVTRRPVNAKEYKARYAVESDASILINEDTLLVEDGNPIVLYKKIDWCDTELLRKACQTVKYTTDTRLPKKESKGITTRSAIFGYKPRIPLRQDFCSAAAMASGQTKHHQIVTRFAENLTEIYKTYFPETFAYHEKLMNEKVKPEWRIPRSVFTSGIINKNNPLQYHHDTGNFKHVLSNMVAFKYGMTGGRLVMPEYDMKLEIADNTVSIFDGQSIVHGVTPLIKMRPDAYRYTIVYYSLEQMWKCDSIKEEVLRIRKLKKEREMKRL